MDEEKLTAIIGIRVEPKLKEVIKKEAERLNMTISDFVLECIAEGYKFVERRDVKQGQFSEK